MNKKCKECNFLNICRIDEILHLFCIHNKPLKKFSLCDNCLDKNICLLYERQLLPKDYRCLRNPRKIRKHEFLSKLFNEYLND